MQFKIFLAVSITLLISLAVTAQTIRKPFADIDKEEKVLTLTNGKYEEFFDDDSLQRIGTALININTMKVVKLLLSEEEQRIMDNSESSRFLSVDPLVDKYPELTPYQFTNNSPIANLDLDGQEDYYYILKWNANGQNPQLNLATVKDDLIPGFMSGVYINGQYVGDKLTPKGAQQMAQHYGTFTKDQFEAYRASVVQSNARMKQRSDEMSEDFANAAAMGVASQTPRGAFTGWGKGNSPASGAQKQQSAANNKVTPNGSKQPISKPISPIVVKNTTPQNGEGFGSQSYTLLNGNIKLTSRSVTNGTFDFVVTNDGKLVIGSGHYNLSGGSNSVIAAGQISLYKGRVTNINNSSGHYQPTFEQAKEFGNILNRAGVNVDGANLNLYDKAGKKVEKIKL